MGRQVAEKSRQDSLETNSPNCPNHWQLRRNQNENTLNLENTDFFPLQAGIRPEVGEPATVRDTRRHCTGQDGQSSLREGVFSG